MNLPKMIKDLAKAIYTEKTARENLAVRVNTQRVGGTNILFDSEFAYAQSWGAAASRIERSALSSGRKSIKVLANQGITVPIGMAHTASSQKTQIIQNEAYTLSFYARASVLSRLDYIYLMRRDGWNHVLPAITVGLEWQRVFVTFIAPWTSEQAGLLIGCRVRNATDIFSFEFHSVKLETGNVATDWSPSPADLQAQNDALKTEIAAIKQRLERLEAP